MCNQFYLAADISTLEKLRCTVIVNTQKNIVTKKSNWPIKCITKTQLDRNPSNERDCYLHTSIKATRIHWVLNFHHLIVMPYTAKLQQQKKYLLALRFVNFFFIVILYHWIVHVKSFFFIHFAGLVSKHLFSHKRIH